ncbi:MAG: PadR family transcriptional regulator [Solirubrobacteraceae bacterium]
MASKGPTRVSERGLLILISLAHGEKHGYALMQDIDEFAHAKLGPGTLYALLSKLEEEALVEALPAHERRRPFRITPLGREALRVQLKEHARLARIGLERIALNNA